MPNVPWALPQIPMAFPVLVPPVGWPSFLGGEHQNDAAQTDVDHSIDTDVGEVQKGMGAGALRAARDWRAAWEKWMALATWASEDVPPPKYTPRASEVESLHPSTQTEGEADGQGDAAGSTSNHPPSNVETRVVARRVGYKPVVPVTDQEVNAFGYQPPTKQIQKLQKKREFALLIALLKPILIQ